MDHNSGNKRPNVNPLNENSPKAQKMERAHKDPASSKSTNFEKYNVLSSSNIIQLSNIDKLRMQIVEELKNIEFPLKETIKKLKLNISEVKNKADNVLDEMKKENALLCSQRELVDAKDEENKILREKLEELYIYQNVIFETVQDISTTIDFNHNLVEKLTNMFNSILIMQENDLKTLEDKLNNVTPDEKYIIKLDEINLKIKEEEEELLQSINENNQLELEIKAIKIHSEEEKQKVSQLDQKILDLEKRNEALKKDGLKQKNDLLNEIEILKQEANVDKVKIVESESKITELKNKLEMNRNEEKELETILKQLSKESDLLAQEKEELIKQTCDYDQQSQISLEQHQEELKITQHELNSIEQKQNQAVDVLQKKISEMYIKLKSYGNIDSKLKEVEKEIKVEEELLKQIRKEGELKKKALSDEIKLHYDKIHESNAKISKIEQGISEDDKKVKQLEKEITEINEKIVKYEATEKSSKIKLSENINQYKLPELKDLGNSDNKTRRQLYTPTTSDEMDIDSLSIDEQVIQLTQSKSSPEKKFFKPSSQSKTKRDSTPRSKGRPKNN